MQKEAPNKCVTDGGPAERERLRSLSALRKKDGPGECCVKLEAAKERDV